MKNLKLFVVSVLAMFMAAVSVNAQALESCDDSAVAKVDGTCYTDLKEAINKGGEVTVLKDTNLATSIVVKNSVTIDLNDKTVTVPNTTENAKYSTFYVMGGTLNITGNGSIVDLVEQDAHAFAGIADGSRWGWDPCGPGHIIIGAGVTITTASAGIMVDPVQEKAAESTIDIAGKVEGTREGFAPLYVQGANKSVTKYPVITVRDGAEITNAKGIAIYQAGYSDITIGKANISGITAIAIKSGKLTLNGSIVTATGEKKDPVSDNNGVNATGAAIQIESNSVPNGYAGNIEININGGTYTSEHGYVILEYVATGKTATSIDDINITAGTFDSNADDGKALSLSPEFASAFTDESFIDAGTIFIADGEAAEDVLTYAKGLTISESGVVGIVSDIEITESENGEVTADKENAAEGEEVTLTVTPVEGYELDTLVITDEDGNVIEVIDNKFTMPETKVTITATFKLIEKEPEVSEEQKPTETEPNPDTYDASMSYMGLALLSLGTMIVSIKKLRNN